MNEATIDTLYAKIVEKFETFKSENEGVDMTGTYRTEIISRKINVFKQMDMYVKAVSSAQRKALGTNINSEYQQLLVVGGVIAHMNKDDVTKDYMMGLAKKLSVATE
ncbi:MAG: hypothetical protein ABIB43_02460 [archaeon]